MLASQSRVWWFRAAICVSLVVVSLAHSRKFPPGFLLGTSTSSYQIEGAWNVSGKGENTWDHLMKVNPNHTGDHKWGDVACDSYHHIDRDVEMLRELGLDVYRFSLSWSRLLPTGYSDVINPDGVLYYNNLINALLANGITPMVTIFHWDLPQSLQDIGGWPNPELAYYFVDYANIAFRLFGDRVKLWVSFNEPHQYCRSSYGLGNNAPALNSSGLAEYLCGHTILRAHAKTYHLYKQAYAAQKGKISLTLDAQWYEPKNAQWPPDADASERMMEFELGWFANPIYSPTGGYPPIMVKRIAEESRAQGLSRSRLPHFTNQERAALIGSTDFFSLNHYTTLLIEHKSENPDWPIPSRERDLKVSLSPDPAWKKSAVIDLWDVPWGLRKLLNWIRTHYNNPVVYITENGYPDGGGLEDNDRIAYYTGYLNAVLDAVYKDKCNVVGYTVWSLMDNFEWRCGYKIKFGLYDVDFTDPARTRKPKLSAEYFKQLGAERVLPCSIEDCANTEGTTGSNFGTENTPDLKESLACSNTSVAFPREKGPAASAQNSIPPLWVWATPWFNHPFGPPLHRGLHPTPPGYGPHPPPSTTPRSFLLWANPHQQRPNMFFLPKGL